MTLNLHVFANQADAEALQSQLAVQGWTTDLSEFDHVLLNDYLGPVKPKLVYDKRGTPLWVLRAEK